MEVVVDPSSPYPSVTWGNTCTEGQRPLVRPIGALSEGNGNVWAMTYDDPLHPERSLACNQPYVTTTHHPKTVVMMSEWVTADDGTQVAVRYPGEMKLLILPCSWDDSSEAVERRAAQQAHMAERLAEIKRELAMA